MWPFKKREKPKRKRQLLLPEEIEEEKIAGMDMHYGDEPLYYSDPPEWPLR